MKLDLTKPIQIRDGRPVEILKTNAKGNRPIIGLIANDFGEEWPCSWTAEGKRGYGENSHFDLVNVPQTIDKWMALYRDEFNDVCIARFFDTEEQAKTSIKKAGLCPPFAIVNIKCSEGDGL